MKAWLKGGLIGIAIFLVFYVTMNIINVPGGSVFRNLIEPFMFTDPLSIINYVLLVGSFAIGALIGWIVGKIKAKKQETAAKGAQQ